MNGEELVDKVTSKVLDPDYDRDAILGFVNRARLAVAGRVLMPGLADGLAIVETVVGGNVVAMPATYHRGLYLARVAGEPVRVYANVTMMAAAGHGLDNKVGSISAVAVHAGNLMYQKVPSAVTQIQLLYYRKPAVITDSQSSVPEGLGSNLELQDDYDQALFAYACAEIFSEIEQGLEGAKVDTAFYTDLYEKAIGRMVGGVARNRPRPAPTVCKTRWP